MEKQKGRPIGTKKDGEHRTSFNVSCYPSQLAELKKKVAESGKTMSAYILEMCGIK